MEIINFYERIGKGGNFMLQQGERESRYLT